jgi:hypothetical protein
MPIHRTPADLVRMTRYELRAYAATSFAAGQQAARELQRRQQKRFRQYEDEMMRVETIATRIAAAVGRGVVNPWSLSSRRQYR